MADEATMRKLDAMVKEKEKQLNENNRIRMKNDTDIRNLKDAI